MAGKSVLALDEGYIRALSRAGGEVYIGLDGNPNETASRMDGIVFSGGGDIHPACYGEKIVGKNLEIDTRRDIPEFALFRAFYAKKKPILGICRGMQLINVALGGTLWQDLETECEWALSHAAGSPPHTVTVKTGSRLAAAVGEKTAVNTFHHQAIRQTGRDLIVTAQSEDGTAEGIEHTKLPILGVQWHPERMDNMGRLFSDFIECVRICARWKRG